MTFGGGGVLDVGDGAQNLRPAPATRAIAGTAAAIVAALPYVTNLIRFIMCFLLGSADPPRSVRRVTGVYPVSLLLGGVRAGFSGPGSEPSSVYLDPFGPAPGPR
jgi:hypothetical protein